MRRTIKIIFIAAVCILLLGGCSQSRQIENQAYVLVLGVDENADGGVTLTAKIPTLAASASEGGAAEDEAYRQFSASGESYHAALERLNRTSSRNLNLAQIELIAVSKALASKPQFRSIIKDIAQTERLFTASYTVICDRRADDFVKALKPSVGSRLSLDIPATLENYIEQGIIPEAKLADLYYLSETMYSDPMAIRASVADDGSESWANAYDKVRIAGAYVFQNGVLTMEMDTDESMIANLIRNEVKYFRYETAGKSVEIAPSAPSRITIAPNKNPAEIRIELTLNIGVKEDMPTPERIRAQLERDIVDLVHKAQENGVDPFGISNVAAGKYATIEQWLNSAWRETYQSANVIAEVKLSLRDA